MEIPSSLITIREKKDDLDFSYQSKFAFDSEEISIRLQDGLEKKLSFFELEAKMKATREGQSLELTTKDKKISVIIKDRRILKLLFKKSPDHIKEVVRPLFEDYKSIFRLHSEGIGVLLLIFFVGWGLLETVSILGRKAVLKMPVEMEISFGDMAYQLVTDKKSELNDPALDQILNQITKPLLDQLSNKTYQYKFHLIKSSTANALSLPGGNIVIYTELIQKTNSAEELAGVLAHEISHVELRHSLTALGNKIGVNLFIALLPGIFGDLSEVLGDLAPYLLELSFSREQEIKADEQGLDLLRKAAINPEGMLSFFEKLSKTEEDNMGSMLTFVSTHPNSEDRLSRLKKLMAKGNFPKATKIFSINWEDFKSRLKADKSA